jgi:hypothetical protein
MAIAAFVLSLMAFVLISVPLGIAALVRIRRSGARGKVFAILSLVISGLWLLFIGVVIAVAVLIPSSPSRNSAGAVTAPLTVEADELKVGDCLVRVPSTTSGVRKLDVTPCKNPHRAEVFATFDLPSGSFPGETEVTEKADAGCSQRVPDVAAAADGDLDILYLYPQRVSWRLGDRSVTCMVVSEKKPLTGRLVP